MRLKNFTKNTLKGRMTALSDTLTVSLVLILLFGSIALYLYTRIQQAEQRINLLESILLELKMSSEVKSYTELPASESEYDNEPHKYMSSPPTSSIAEYTPFEEADDEELTTNDEVNSVASSKHSIKSVEQLQQQQEQKQEEVDVDFYKSVLDSSVKEEVKPRVSSTNYDGLNIKELHSLAKQRGITGATTMKKQAIIDALRASDKTEPGFTGVSSSFLDQSSSFLDQTPTGTLVINE